MRYFKKFFDFSRAILNVKTNFSAVIKVNYQFWPFVNYLNFKFVPLLMRTVVINFCATLWNGYLAFRNNKYKNREIVKQPENLDFSINVIPE